MSEREHTNKDDSVSHYSYREYACPGKRKPFDMVHACDMPVLKVSDLDARVWEWIKSDIANPTILQRKLLEIQAGQQSDHSRITETIASLSQHKATIEEELRRLAMLFAQQQLPQNLIQQLIGEQNQNTCFLRRRLRG
jgi:hypothetical protein